MTKLKDSGRNGFLPTCCQNKLKYANLPYGKLVYFSLFCSIRYLTNSLRQSLQSFAQLGWLAYNQGAIEAS